MTGSEAIAVAALVRWTNLAALAGVVGGLVTELLVLPRDASERGAVAGRLRRLTLASLAMLVVASGADLVVRAQAMAGGGFASAVAALPLVLGRTHFGVMWRLRAAAVAIAAVLYAPRVRWAHVAALATMLAVVFTLAASGHAADWGDATGTMMVDWVHASAALTWGGGLASAWWCVFRVPALLAPAALATITRRFSRLALVCVAVIVLTGAVNVRVEVAALPALWTSEYGRVLALKLAVVLGAVALGATNRYRVLPALAQSTEPMRERVAGCEPARRLLSRYVAGEVFLVVVVFACTALLGQLPPPRRGDASHDGQGAISHMHGE